MTWKNTKREAEMRRERWRQGDERGPQKDVRLRPEARELERQTQGRWGGGGDKTGGGKVGTSRVEKEEDEETAGGEKKERKRERRIQRRREATG